MPAFAGVIDPDQTLHSAGELDFGLTVETIRHCDDLKTAKASEIEKAAAG
jgi:hypothetical protein